VTRLVGYTRELLPGLGTTADAEELVAAGAVLVFIDDGAADPRARPGLVECLRDLERGDVLVVTSAARLSHTVPHFLAIVADLGGRGVGFRSLAEPALCAGLGERVDPSEVFGALEALRHRLVSVQTRTGMASAAREGRRPGRPTVMTEERVAIAVELRNVGRPITHIARVLGVSPNAVQRALASISGPDGGRV